MAASYGFYGYMDDEEIEDYDFREHDEIDDFNEIEDSDYQDDFFPDYEVYPNVEDEDEN